MLRGCCNTVEMLGLKPRKGACRHLHGMQAFRCSQGLQGQHWTARGLLSPGCCQAGVRKPIYKLPADAMLHAINLQVFDCFLHIDACLILVPATIDRNE